MAQLESAAVIPRVTIRVGTLRIAPRDLTRILAELPYREPLGRTMRAWHLIHDGVYACVQDCETELTPPNAFWASKDPKELAIWAETPDVLRAFGNTLVRLAVDYGVANISWTAWP